MRYHDLTLVILMTFSLAAAQQLGATAEEHPSLPTWKCTTGGGCAQQNTSVVIDWNYRGVLTSSGTPCVDGSQPNSHLCPDPTTCYNNCFVQGKSAAEYVAAGISVSNDALTLKQWVTSSTGETYAASPRVYLLDSGGQNYVMLQLLGGELSYDVDASALPCGENGALYLSQMDASGGRSATNPGGASYGAGYCDAQCPVMAFQNGTANVAGHGYCCGEMDIMEGNGRASAFTPHPCKASGPGTDLCDKFGCGFNPYSQGFTNYYGPKMTVDTTKKFTVTTRFVADSSGALGRIERVYTQGGRTVASAVNGGDSLTAAGCTSAASYGGMAAMGRSLGQGMVLIMSIWNDPGGHLNWLDSGNNGPCKADEGDPATIQKKYPGVQVVFSNIRWGDIGSTTVGRRRRQLPNKKKSYVEETTTWPWQHQS